jgi:glycosyltransferase involved in cell wall biosynthesis
MAAAVPVIASRVEGVPEAVVDGESGVLVEPGQPGSLAAAIESLVRAKHDYRALSRQAQQRHAELFSAEIMARNVADVYDKVLGR